MSGMGTAVAAFPLDQVGRAGQPSGDRGAGECDRGGGRGGLCAVDRRAGAAWAAAAPAGSGDPRRGRRRLHRHGCGANVAPSGQRGRPADGRDRVLVAGRRPVLDPRRSAVHDRRDLRVVLPGRAGAPGAGVSERAAAGRVRTPGDGRLVRLDAARQPGPDAVVRPARRGLRRLPGEPAARRA